VRPCQDSVLPCLDTCKLHLFFTDYCNIAFYYYFLTFSNIFHFFACITLSVLLQISTDSESRVTSDGRIGLPVAVRSKLLHHWLFVALAH